MPWSIAWRYRFHERRTMRRMRHFFHGDFAMKTSRSSSRGTGRRSSIKPKGDARFIRRDSRGRITESDDVGRSLKTDRRQKAKRKVRSGYGDRGDR
jgi:hypothetical protein